MQYTENNYARRTLGFVERMNQLNDYDLICREIENELCWYGLTSNTIMKIPGPMDNLADGIFLNTRPTEYLDHYVDQNYLVKDPIITELSHTVKPYSWNDIRQKRRLPKKQKFIIDEGREFGATDGFVVPIHTMSGELSIFSPCGENPDLSSQARSSLEIIGMYSYEMLKRSLIQKQKDKITYKPLTLREREVLSWVAAGKTDDEISTILSISMTTVACHVDNAKHKLGAYKRTYAIVQAIKLREISL
ncbi:MAG: LuxR family transcriptional regulator [bacterium]|nr:LuxR family transcriptional regulator [bacterium]